MLSIKQTTIVKLTLFPVYKSFDFKFFRPLCISISSFLFYDLALSSKFITIATTVRITLGSANHDSTYFYSLSRFHSISLYYLIALFIPFYSIKFSLALLTTLFLFFNLFNFVFRFLYFPFTLCRYPYNSLLHILVFQIYFHADLQMYYVYRYCYIFKFLCRTFILSLALTLNWHGVGRLKAMKI